MLRAEPWALSHALNQDKDTWAHGSVRANGRLAAGKSIHLLRWTLPGSNRSFRERCGARSMKAAFTVDRQPNTVCARRQGSTKSIGAADGGPSRADDGTYRYAIDTVFLHSVGSKVKDARAIQQIAAQAAANCATPAAKGRDHCYILRRCCCDACSEAMRAARCRYCCCPDLSACVHLSCRDVPPCMRCGARRQHQRMLAYIRS